MSTARGPAARAGAALLSLFAVCGLAHPAAAPPGDASAAGAATPEPPPVAMYLARRSWHIDVGFAVRDLDPSLAFIARRFPRAKYLFFGFGDRHYLLSDNKGAASLAGALFPGPGLILLTAIENSPVQAFGGPHVLEFVLPVPQAAAAQRFVRHSLAGSEGDIPSLAEGPYEGSVYYAAVARYSALHTCNTWAAEALKSAGFKVHTHLVLFAGQTWHEALKMESRPAPRSAPPEGILAPGSHDINRRAAGCRSGTRPSSSSPAGPPPWSSAEEAGSSC